MPTIKQKKAFKRTMENNGSVSKSMLEVGYSPNHAKNPQSLTESNGWKELLKEHLSDESLTREHRKVLEQDKDLGNKMKAVDIGYKLKGKFKEDNSQKSPQTLLVQFIDANS